MNLHSRPVANSRDYVTFQVSGEAVSSSTCPIQVRTWRSALKAHEIENWVRQVVDRIKSGRTTEDSRVELKALWPADANRAARQIGGSCNAAVGDLVLWLIGVDEQRGVVGVNAADMASWWPSIIREFDTQPPSMRELAIGFAEGDIVALLFETDRAPFVVKNAVHGHPGGGPVAWEVPWREGTSVRTATRADLLRLLVPAVEIPQLQVHAGEASLHRKDERLTLIVTVTVYAIAPFGPTLVFPNHGAEGWFTLPQMNQQAELTVSLSATSTTRWNMRPDQLQLDERMHTIYQGDQQIIVSGPGFFRIHGRIEAALDLSENWSSPLDVNFRMRPAGSDLSATVAAALMNQEPRGNSVAEWRLS